jgi:hypothetical protein
MRGRPKRRCSKRCSADHPTCGRSREQLAAHPDAIEVPQHFLEKGWVRVAVDAEDRPVGFSVVISMRGPVLELDGCSSNQIR